MQTTSDVMTTIENIRNYPQERFNASNQCVVIGDLHGNAMKLIYFLQRYGIIDLKDSALFDELWAIYETPTDDLTEQNLKRFEFILEQVDITLPGLVVLIGDEFADRGRNDYFTIVALRKLHTAEVPFRILLSNHSSYFISYLSQNERNLGSLNPGQERSLDNFILLTARFDWISSVVQSFFDDVYCEHISLIGYFEFDDKFYILTHAPTNPRLLQAVSAKLQIDYDDASIQSLTDTFDKLNEACKESLLSGKWIDDYCSTPWDESSSIFYFLWNRTDEPGTLPFSSINIHGHVGDRISRNPSYINLDSQLGKSEQMFYDSATKQVYSILAVDEGACPVFYRLASQQILNSPYCQEGVFKSDSDERIENFLLLFEEYEREEAAEACPEPQSKIGFFEPSSPTSSESRKRKLTDEDVDPEKFGKKT